MKVQVYVFEWILSNIHSSSVIFTSFLAGQGQKSNCSAQMTHTLRDVFTGATGATEVAPKFSDTLTLSPPGGADSAHHRRGRI